MTTEPEPSPDVAPPLPQVQVARATGGAGSPPKGLAGRFAPYRKVARWVTAIALLAVAARVLIANPEPLRRAAALPPRVLAVLVPLALLNHLFISWRMSLALVQAGGPKVPGSTWFKLVILGQFMNLFVPQLGNVYRGVALKRDHGVSYTTYASGLLTFVWLDTLFGFTICLAVLSVLSPGLSLFGFPALLLTVLSLVALLTAPVLASRLLKGRAEGSGAISRVRDRAGRLVKDLTAGLRTPSFMLRFFTVSVLVTLVQVAVLRLCFEAVGYSIDLPTAAVFQVFIKLSNQVVVTPGNLGVMEFAFGALGVARGGDLEHGIAASLVFRALFTSTVIVLGLLLGGANLLRSSRRELAERRGDHSAT